MDNVTLSYIITTRNKLPYLKKAMIRLLENIKEGEEIIIADGASADGTKDFLKELHKQKKIHCFVSEPDIGESHALNKLFFRARGDLVRIITDDDAFYYPGIQECKKFMLEHPEIDMLGTNGGFKNQLLKDEIRPLNYQNNYRQWQKDRIPFSSCGLGLMIRKSSLPILGLWNPSFRKADAEFMLRVTSGPANIAWHNAPTFVNISNPQSVSAVYMKKIKDETDRLNKFYFNKSPDSFLVQKLKIIRNKIRSEILHREPSSKEKHSQEEFRDRWLKMFAASEKWLEIKNKEKKPEFLWNTRK